MIDFKNKKFFKMLMVSNTTFSELITPMLMENENIEATYQSGRDGIIFTDYHIIAINVQDSGKKKSVAFISYKSIKVFQVETAGHIDLDSEIMLYIQDGLSLHFGFTRDTDIIHIGTMISQGMQG